MSAPVDPDIRRAATLHPRSFRDRETYERMLAGPFAASWQLVRDCGDVGAIVPFDLLPGALNEPLVWTRGGEERVLSRVCTHRGALLCEGDCEASDAIVCGYHGRRFGLDGKLERAPGFDGAEVFPSAADDLPRLECERVGPLRFTRLNPNASTAVSFDVWSAPLVALLAEYEGEELAFAPEHTRDYDVPAHWALYVENYLEGFHVPFVHPSLNRALDPVAYRTELFPNGVRQVGIARQGAEAVPCLRRAAEPDVAGDYLWLFPNLMVNAYPWGVSVNLVEPTGPTSCRVRYLRWVARPELQEQGAGAGLDAVELEDQAVVASAQRGVRSSLYRGGRFAPEHETGPHWFERLLAREMELHGTPLQPSPRDLRGGEA